jgi:hypothetical protein
VNPLPRQRVAYTRGFLDLRRYNRVSAEGQLNLRLVFGGWLGGDPLPLQRRLSLGGAGTLPGFDFRDRLDGGANPLTCSTPTPPLPGGLVFIEPIGRPAQCERIALAQVEYRGDLTISIGGGWEEDEGDERPRRRRWHHLGFRRVAQWVVFADAGRGWLVTETANVPEELREGRGSFPRLDTFETDVGAGLDFGVVGFFLAKSTSDTDEPLNFFVRLRHRF